MEAAGKRYILHPSRSDWFTIWNLSDLHLGNRACALKQFKADVQRVRADPHAFWVSTGDNAEFITFNDGRFDPLVIDPTLTVADLASLGTALASRLAALFAPIRDKCLGIGMGNHEKKYMQHNDCANLHTELCDALDVPDLQYSSLFDLVFVRVPRSKHTRYVGTERTRNGLTTKSFRVYTHHGSGGATTRGGKLNRLIRYMQDFEADIYMVGHMHDQKGQRIPKVGANAACDDLTSHDTIGVVSGAYLKTYSQGSITYGEIKGYSPTTLGAAFVKLRPDTGEMKGEI